MMHFFRHPERDQWHLVNVPFDPAKSGGVACIAAVEGPVPTGARAWSVYTGGKWDVAEVTAREVA
jgi:hypothetical protein